MLAGKLLLINRGRVLRTGRKDSERGKERRREGGKEESGREIK